MTSAGDVQNWQITHWNPGKRIDFEIESGRKRCGYSFTFDESSDQQHVEVRLILEFEFAGISRIFGNFLARSERKKASSLLEDFIAYLQKLNSK